MISGINIRGHMSSCSDTIWRPARAVSEAPWPTYGRVPVINRRRRGNRFGNIGRTPTVDGPGLDLRLLVALCGGSAPERIISRSSGVAGADLARPDYAVMLGGEDASVAS